MDESNINKKVTGIAKEVYPSIGEFVVQYEKVCYNLRFEISKILEKEGLKNNKLSEILIGGLTITPLINIFRSLILEIKNPDEKGLKLINKVFSQIVKLAKERNKIVHSAWFVDNTVEAENETLKHIRPGYNKKGAKPSINSYSIEKIKEWSRKANYLSQNILQIGTCIWGDIKLSDNLDFDKDQNVIIKGR